MNSKIVEIIILLFRVVMFLLYNFIQWEKLIESFGNVCGWLPY